MTRNYMPGLAVNIKETVASNTTCTAGTVAQLRSCLFPKTSIPSDRSAPDGNPATIAARRLPKSKGAQPKREIRSRGKKLPNITIHETPEADNATAANIDRSKLATEVINVVLKALTENVRARSLAQETCKGKGPNQTSSAAPPTNLLNGRPGTETPLQPLSVNVVCSEKGQCKKSRQPSRQSICSADANPGNGFAAQAECARLAFSALKALDEGGNLGKKLPFLQLENAMSTLVTKLIALDLFEPAWRQLRAMKRSLLLAAGKTDNVESLASKDPDKAERLSDLLVFPVTSVTGPLLAMMVTFQLQVLRLIAANGDAALFRSTIEHLQMNSPYSPQRLMQAQYDMVDPMAPAKITNQLEALLRIVLSMCPSISSLESQKLDHSKVVDPLTLLRFQLLGLELRCLWRELAGHKGDVTKNLLLPFGQYLSAFRRRCSQGSADGYCIAKSVLASLPLHNLDKDRSTSAMAEENEALLSIYSEMLVLTEKNRLTGETEVWLQKYMSLPIDCRASSCKRCTLICKKALVYAQASTAVSSKEEVVNAFREAEQSVQGNLDGASEELDELLLVVTGLRKAAASIINKSLTPLVSPEKPSASQLVRLCYSLCSTCVKFLNGYIGTRPPNPPEHRLTHRYQQRLDKTLAVMMAFTDSVISIARHNKGANLDQWHQTDTGLRACLSLANLTQDSRHDTADKGKGTSDICVAVSNAYWSRYLHLKETESDTEAALKALRSSIDAVENRELICKIAAQLPTKFEHYGRTLEGAREYRKAAEIYTKAIRLNVEMGVLQKAAAAASLQPVSVLFARQSELTALGRVLTAYSRVTVKTEACTSSKPRIFDDDKLESTQRGILLEHQLLSLISQLEKGTVVTQVNKAIQHLSTDLLDVYTETFFPIHRCRVIDALLWLQSRQPASLSPGFLDPYLDYRIDASSDKLGGLDTGLRLLVPHLNASKDAVLALREDCLTKKQERLTNALATWHSLIAQSPDLDSLDTRVDDSSEWLLRLELLVEYLDACGLSQHRRSTLELLATVREKFFPTQLEELVLNLTQSGLQQLRLGYPSQAGLAFHKVQRLVNEAVAAKETMAWFYIAYAEYFIGIGSVSKCGENLALARELFESIETEQGQNKHSRDQSGISLLVAGAACLGSELAARRGNTSLALLLARHSLTVVHQAWARVERRQKRLEVDNTSISNTSNVEGLVDSISRVNVSGSSTATDGPVVVPKGPLYWRLVPHYHRALLQVSRLYEEAGMSKEAQYYLERSQKLAATVSVTGLAVRSVSRLADLLARSGSHREADDKFEVASRQFALLKEDQHLVEHQTNLAKHYLAKGQLSAAERTCVAAEGTFRRLLNPDCLRESFIGQADVDALQGQLSQLSVGKDDHCPSGSRKRATKHPPKSSLPITKSITASKKSSPDIEAPSLALHQARRSLSRLRILLAMQQIKFERAREMLSEAATQFFTSEDVVVRALMNAEIHVSRGLEVLNSDPVYCVLHESTVSLPSVASARRPELLALPKATMTKTGRKPTKRGAVGTDSEKLQPAGQLNCVGPGAEFIQAQTETNKVYQLARSVCATATLHHLSKIMSDISLKLSALNPCVGQEGPKATANGLLGISDMASSVSMSRGRLAVQVDKALPTGDGLLVWPDAYAEDTKQLNTANETLDSSTVHEQCLDMIPPNWQVLTVSLSRSKGEIQVSRMRSGQGTFVLSLPLDRHSSRDPDEENFGYSQAKTELQDIIKLADISTHSVQDTSRKGSKSAWWEGRAALDARLKDLLTNMQNMWFGGFQGVFSQQLPARESLSRFQESLNIVLDNHLPSRRGLGKKPRSQQVNLDPRVVELFVALGDPALFSDMEEPLMDLLYFVVDILQFTGERNAYDEIDFDAMIIEIFDALRQYHEVAKKADEQSAVEHTVLILDKDLHCFPWESLPCLDGQAVTRLLSLSCLRDRLLRQREQQIDEGSAISGKHGFCVDRRSGAYVLNAAGDLKATQTQFEQPLRNMGGVWEGVTESKPSENQLKNYLHERDIFLYFGHGSGSQYIRSSTIRKLDRCAVALLMGCSSGTLTEAGEFEPYGTPMSYMQAECPAMVATLWDVTDKDIDRFSETTLQKWGLFESHISPDGSPVKKSTRAKGKSKARRAPALNSDNGSLSLDQAVTQGRGSCIFRYLNGAAPVVYGIPVFLS